MKLYPHLWKVSKPNCCILSYATAFTIIACSKAAFFSISPNGYKNWIFQSQTLAAHTQHCLLLSGKQNIFFKLKFLWTKNNSELIALTDTAHITPLHDQTNTEDLYALSSGLYFRSEEGPAYTKTYLFFQLSPMLWWKILALCTNLHLNP